MQKALSKGTAIILALAMFGSMLAGCGASKSSGGDTTKPSATATEDTKKEAPVDLKIEVFERGTQGFAPADNNFWTKWINENFGKPNNINVIFYPIARAEEVNKLNVLMAANEAPDLIYTYDAGLVSNYATRGGLQDLTPLLDKNGQKLKSFLGKETLDYGVFNGKQYAIPAKRVIQGAVGYHIRKDWLDKLGLPIPTNKDEFYNVMKAFKEKDPGGLGDKTIPFGTTVMYRSWSYGLLYTFLGQMSEEDWYSLSFLAMPGYKDGLKYMNKLYNEGLISPEFAIDKDSKKLQADISNGRVGFFMYNIGNLLKASLPVLTTLAKNNPSAEYVACDPFVNSEGKRVKFASSPFGIFNMVPANSKRAAEVVKYLDWMSDPDVLKILQNGFEGEMYDLKDGIPMPKAYDGEKKLYAANNIDYTAVVNGRYFGSQDLNLKAEALNNPGFEKLYTDTAKASMTDMLLAPYFKGLVNASANKYGAQLNTKMDELTSKLIMCKPSEFDKLYEEALNDYLKSGGQEITDESRKLYQQMKKN